MTSGSAAAPAAIASNASTTKKIRRFLSRYFYFCASAVMAGLAVWGFSHTVDARLLHAAPPRPLLLWFHATVFSGLDRPVHRTVRPGARAQGQHSPRTGLVWSGVSRDDGRLWLRRFGSHVAIRHHRASHEDGRVVPVDRLVRHDHFLDVHCWPSTFASDRKIIAAWFS